MNGFKYGTILTPQNFWCKWKRDDHKIGESLTDKESFLSFSKRGVFDLFRYGVINDGGGTKKCVLTSIMHYRLLFQD